MGLLLLQLTEAQLCQGSLGDPIVNITFGAGSNPGPPLAAATTNYQYLADDCPNDGFYTVRNSTKGCYTGWHSLTSDHTGNTNGYFMLVNASREPSAFYVDTVNLICNNTIYEFAAWIMNMNQPFECSGSPNKPNLTFSIEKTDGTLLQSYNTGDIDFQSEAIWRQYGFFFATPLNMSRVVLRIVNNAQGGCGNDLALDDITFRPCGPQVKASITGDGTEESFCEEEVSTPGFSSEVSAGFIDPGVQWQQRTNNSLTWINIPGATAGSFTPVLSTARAGTYQYRLSVSQPENRNEQTCAVNSNVLTIRINPKPVPAAANTGPACEEQIVTLSARDGGQYHWSGVNGFSATGATVTLANAQPLQSGKYYVEVTTDSGCKRIDSTQVVINPRPVAAASSDRASICEGTGATLTSTGGSAYLWKPAQSLLTPTAASTRAFPKDTTNYMVIVSNAFSCTDTAYVQVNVIKKPRANAGPDRYMLEGQSVQLLGEAGGTNISYSWAPALFMDDTTSLHPHVNPSTDFVYTLQVASHDSCGSATDSVKVKVYKAVYVPNAFTPNGDGLNDTWNIPALNAFANYEIRVFNRWGQLVYHSENKSGWDGRLNGKEQPTGVYPYVISIKDTDVILKGWVTIVR
jgi:gliding motility-associated-like protein